MNLMFRKNFREGLCGKASGAANKLQAKANRAKRSRDLGLSQPDDIHYRTHLFFSPNRAGYDVAEETCSSFSGACTQLSTTTTTYLTPPSLPHEADAPQPLVDRKPSVSIVRWSNSSARLRTEQVAATTSSSSASASATATATFLSTSSSTSTSVSVAAAAAAAASTPGSGAATPKSARQAAFGGGPTNNVATAASAAGPARSEPVSLAALDRDCFVIPMHCVDRFLPAGIPLPPSPADGATVAVSPQLSVLEVADPKLCVLVHLMSPLEPIDPVLESPLAHPLLKQRAIAAELLSEVQQANSAVGGMLLANMEKNSEFPFIAYYLINATQTDPAHFYSGMRVSSLSKFEPKVLKYTAAHTLDLYSEVAAICRPPLLLTPNESGGFKKTQTAATGYIISVFKVFEGDDGERFERNWLYWTGARMLYRYLPRTVGLRRIALHKSTSQKGDKMYLLVCECADLLKDISSAAVLIPALRARLCGYTGLYRPIQVF